MTDPILDLSAHDLIAAFRARTLSPVEALAAVTARAAEVEPTVNALVDELPELALAAAQEAERRYAGQGEPPRALEGVPLAIKEEQPIAGLSWRMGSLTTEGLVADETHPVVERVLAAGAVVHARTTTPEFSCAAFTESTLWGLTTNPWNAAYGPGGSSGGSGAALAAQETFLATGSDIGGSIRIPSSLNGIVGFKPPYARVPGIPPFNLDTYCHDGPMGRSVADVALLQNVIAGQHPIDPVSLPTIPPMALPLDPDSARGLRVAVATVVGDFPVDPDVRANTARFADALRAAGLVVTQVELPITREMVTTAALVHFGAIFGPSITPDGGEPDPRLTTYARDFARLSTARMAEIGFYRGLELESQVQAAIMAVFADHDALVVPTLGTTGYAAGDDFVGHGITVDGIELEHYLEGAFTPIFNIASRHPVLAVPSGIAGNGVPTGVQVVGRPYDDATVFIVGAAAERELRWWADPAWRPSVGAGVGSR